MALVRSLLAALALAGAVPAQAEQVSDWAPYITEASRRFGVPTSWIERVMQAESKGRTALGGRPIRSRAGAIGLMQLMPATWADMRLRLGLGPDPDNPRDNILAGTFYLRLMYDRFGYPGLFAAYNAGPARYAAHLASGHKLPGETIAYLQVVSGPNVQTPTPGTGEARDPLFAVRNPGSDRPSESAFSQVPRGLFAVRNDGR